MLTSLDIDAQCAMCKAVVESGMDTDNKVIMGQGINKGIYILMVIPYVLLGIIFYNMYKVRQAERNEHY
ncbi:MAG: hypothetical protein AAF487_08380 [Bacteroidota bacterium]